MPHKCPLEGQEKISAPDSQRQTKPLQTPLKWLYENNGGFALIHPAAVAISLS